MTEEQFRAFEWHCRSSEIIKKIEVCLWDYDTWDARPQDKPGKMLTKVYKVKGYDKDAPLTEEFCYYCEEPVKDCVGYSKCPQLEPDKGE